MKAVYIESHGGVEALKVGPRPDPKAAAGEVVVNVRACSLNHLDVWVRRGGKRTFPLPLVLGSDAAGVREDTGDEVVIFPGVWTAPPPRTGATVATADDFGLLGATRDGAMAEKVAVPLRNLLPKPPELSFVQAAAVPVTFVTAWHMLIERAKVRPGEWVLVNSAGSGVSTAGIQIAALAGATVIATSSTGAKLEHARALGAAHVINYRTEDVAGRVREITGGRGVDVAFDHVARATFAANMASLAKGGRLVICGTTGGPEVELNVAPFYYQAQSILGSTLGTVEDLAACLRLIAAGRLRTVIDRTFPMDQIADAHAYMEDQKQIGKVVIEIAPS